MKKIAALFLIVMFLFALPFISSAKDIKVTLSWDPDTIDEGQTGLWQSLKFFKRDSDTSYDYESPFYMLPQEYVDGKSTPTTTEVLTVSFPDDAVTTMYFVVRSYSETLDKESADSNETSLTVDLVRPDPIDFISALYDESTDAIKFQFSSTDDRLIEWKLYGSLTSGSPYEWTKVVKRIEGQSDYEVSVPIDELITDGSEEADLYFVLAGGTQYVYSLWGKEVTVNVDRTIPQVINLKINLE